MSTTQLSFPKQRLSFKEKAANDYQYGKDMIDLLSLTYANHDSNYSEDYKKKLSWYRTYNNEIRQEDFRADNNPLGIDVTKWEDNIRPYNKAYNKIQVLLGEELKRPLNYRTVLVNSEGIKSKQLEASKKLQDMVQEHMDQFIATINEGDPEKAQEFLQRSLDESELGKIKGSNFLSAKEHLANSILKYMVHEQRIKEKMNDGFKHGLIAGDEFAWVGIRNGKPVVDVLNSLGVFYEKSPEVKYVEDGMYAGFRTMMTVPDILSNFSDMLREEDKNRLETTYAHSSGFTSKLTKDMKYQNNSPYEYYLGTQTSNGSTEGSYGTADYNDYWLVTHCEWRAQRKVYFVEHLNEYGDRQKFMVNEDFEIPEYAEKIIKRAAFGVKKTIYSFDGYTVEEKWVDEIWEGIKIGHDIFCGIGPKPYQSRSVDSPERVKLGYHGVVYNNMNADSVSMMGRMIPFLYLYLIVVHKLKKLIAKDEGQIFHFDVTTLPENMTTEQALFYMKEIGIDFYDPLRNVDNPAIHNKGKVTTSTNWSNMQHIMNYIQLMDNLDFQIADVAGVNRQREGQISNSEAVGNARQNILTSSNVTEAGYFYPHFRHWNNVLTSLLEITQSCWKDKSIIKQYVLDDLSIATLQVEEGELSNSDFGVFLVDSAKEAEAFAMLQQWGQALLQNDKAKFSDMINLIKSESVHELQANIQQAEEDVAKREGEAQQFQQELQQQQVDNQLALEQQKIDADMAKTQLEEANKLRIKQLDNETKIEVARMNQVNRAAKNASKQD